MEETEVTTIHQLLPLGMRSRKQQHASDTRVLASNTNAGDDDNNNMIDKVPRYVRIFLICTVSLMVKEALRGPDPPSPLPSPKVPQDPSLPFSSPRPRPPPPQDPPRDLPRDPLPPRDHCAEIRNLRQAVDAYLGTGGEYSPYGDRIDLWCVSGTVDFSYAFYTGNGRDGRKSSFNRPITRWDVSRATNMSWMLAFNERFNRPLKFWDVSKVQDMSYMFAGAVRFNQDLSTWNVAKVHNMEGLFSLAADFNQSLSTWDVSNVCDTGRMFWNASKFNSDLSLWDVSKVHGMQHMFDGATHFTSDLSPWDVSKVDSMNGMFHGAESFDRDISTWNVAGVKDMAHMFSAASTFDRDLSSWNVSKVLMFERMFDGAGAFRQNLCAWGPHMHPNASVHEMFRNTNCPDKRDPDLKADPVSPLCFVCPKDTLPQGLFKHTEG